MRIEGTNQKTKSIRPACSLAVCGSHGIRSATSAAPAPQAAPIATSWTIDPLRTGDETTGRRDMPAQGSGDPRNACNEDGSASVQTGTCAPDKEVEWDSESVCF